MWEIDKHGFLPARDPSPNLLHGPKPTSYTYRYGNLIPALEELALNLPELLNSRKVREELVYRLRTHKFSIRDLLDEVGDEYDIERYMMLYSYFASAYVYATHEQPANRLPQEIAVPLVALAKKVGRPPILSYASYCLNNWRRIDASGPIALGNIELLQHFGLVNNGGTDESWFVLVHVDIEECAAEAVRAIVSLGLNGKFLHGSVGDLYNGILNSLNRMVKTLYRMPENCSEDVYFQKVRPYIFGFRDVVYDGCFHNQPQTFRGETGAQSSIVPMLLPVLGIFHKDSLLTQHLQVMRDYMPPAHRQFLANIDLHFANHNLRTYAIEHPEFRDLYDACVKQLLAFRSRHFEYAVNYIQKKSPNPEGTGGTPYMPWLLQLKEETEAHLLKK